MASVLAATARVIAIRAVVVLPVVAVLLLWPEPIGSCSGRPPCLVSPGDRLRAGIVGALLLVEVVLIASLVLDALIRRVRRS